MTIYNEWIESVAHLQRAKEAELMLRDAICMVHLDGVLEGSKTVRMQGFKITATARVNRSVNREVLEAIWDSLTDEEKECIDYKPTLKLAKYKPIEATIDSALLEAVTVKPGQSSLKIIPEDVE